MGDIIRNWHRADGIRSIQKSIWALDLPHFNITSQLEGTIQKSGHQATIDPHWTGIFFCLLTIGICLLHGENIWLRWVLYVGSIMGSLSTSMTIDAFFFIGWLIGSGGTPVEQAIDYRLHTSLACPKIGYPKFHRFIIFPCLKGSFGVNHGIPIQTSCSCT